MAAIRIVTDGACKGNPGPGGWAALIIRDDGVKELGGHEPHTTNNRMELRAAIEGLQHVRPDAAVQVVTDSTYLLNGITKWIHGWKKRGWKTASGKPVENSDLWQRLAALVAERDKQIQWQHVYGHTGDPANERANTIAQAHAAGRRPGNAPPNLTAQADAPASPELVEQVAAQRPTTRTYLSLLGDDLQRHPTWDACRARVHGVPGARYKKCTSAAEEIATVRGWGLPADALL
jgi:ribonuclease HI